MTVPEHRNRLAPILHRMHEEQKRAAAAPKPASVGLRHLSTASLSTTDDEVETPSSRKDAPRTVSESVQIDMVTDDQSLITVDCTIGVADSVRVLLVVLLVSGRNGS